MSLKSITKRNDGIIGALCCSSCWKEETSTSSTSGSMGRCHNCLMYWFFFFFLLQNSGIWDNSNSMKAVCLQHDALPWEVKTMIVGIEMEILIRIRTVIGHIYFGPTVSELFTLTNHLFSTSMIMKIRMN